MRPAVGWLLLAIMLVVKTVHGQPAGDREHPSTVAGSGSTGVFTPDLNRFERFRSERPDRACPVPALQVTRDTYFKWLEFSGHFRYAENPAAHGQYGPRHFLPVLAKYVESGDRRYGEACIAMLRSFHAWLKEEIANKGWHSLFGEEMGCIGLYREYLIKGGLLSPDDAWFRDLVSDFADGLHAWGTELSDWRGPSARAQGEGVAKALAAHWYPDVPAATGWKSHASKVYQDWWRFRDLPANDTNYFFGALYPLFLRGVLLPDAKFFTDAEMKPVWERILNEVSPDGSVSPYGASVGWNDTAGLRVAMLEILAARTNDGRYRYVAHRLMNYLVYQRLNYRTNHILMGPQSTEPLAIAYLLANDDLAPVSPDDSSMVLTRKETLRLPGYGVGQNDKKIAADVLGPLPEDDLRGFVSDGLLVTDSVKPSKLVLRSGWNPGDFYVLIDLFPRHDPLNPLGIVGMTRWGAALTCTSPAKGESAENRLIATAGPPTPTPKAPAIQPETTVEAFADSPGVTYASVSVSDYGLPGVSCDRRFLFVKNRFLMTRDDLASEGTVALTAATIFNTQNIEHEAGSNAYRTFMSQPYALGVGMLNPAVDLLVFQCPQPGASDRLRDRAQEDPRTLGVRAQLRHQWTGRLEKDASRHFATLFWPRPPAGPSGPVSMDPQVAVDQMNGRPPRDDIEVILDDDAATMLRTVDEEGVETWLVLNPGGREVEAGGLRTDAEAAFIRLTDGGIDLAWAHKARVVRFKGRDVLDTDGRGTGGGR